MRVEKITFMQTFPTGQFANQKLGIEIAVEPSDNLLGLYAYAKHMVEEAFQNMNKDLQPALTDFNTGQPAALDPRVGVSIMRLIDECETPDELEKYYEDAEKYGLTPTWDKKLKQLKS